MAHSAGSPASRKFLTPPPFTTRPPSTSRQAMMRLVNTSDLAEILEDREPHVSRFLWMELHSENVRLLDGSAELQPVFTRRTGCGQHRRMKRVRVVDKRILRDASQHPRTLLDCQRIPANVRRL